MKNYIKNISKAILAFVFTFIIQALTIISYCTFSVITAITLNKDKSVFTDEFQKHITSSDFMINVSLFYSLLTIAIFGFWYYRKFVKETNLSCKELCENNFMFFKNFKNIFLIAIFIIILECFCNYITTIVQQIFPESIIQYEKLLDSAGITNTSSIPTILYVCILGPLCEELIYRGIIFHYGLKTNNFLIANFLQAFLFGIMHGNLIQFSYAFVLGLVFGIVVYYSNTLIISILIHIGFNTVSMFLNDFLSSLTKFHYLSGFVIYGVISYVLIKLIINEIKKI